MEPLIAVAAVAVVFYLGYLCGRWRDRESENL